MRRKELDDSQSEGSAAKRREGHIRAEAELDALALEMLEPYRALAKPDQPFAPIARRVLREEPATALRLFRVLVPAWGDALYPHITELAAGDPQAAERPTRMLVSYLLSRVWPPLHPKRWKELSGLGRRGEIEFNEREQSELYQAVGLLAAFESVHGTVRCGRRLEWLEQRQRQLARTARKLGFEEAWRHEEGEAGVRKFRAWLKRLNGPLRPPVETDSPGWPHPAEEKLQLVQSAVFEAARDTVERYDPGHLSVFELLRLYADSEQHFRQRLNERLSVAIAGAGWRRQDRQVQPRNSPALEDARRNPLEALEANDRALRVLERLGELLTPGEAEALEALAPHMLAGLSVNAAAKIVAEQKDRSAHTYRELYRRARLKYEAVQHST